jgi:hypothetical protein
MLLRAHRRNLVVWSSPAGPARGTGLAGLTLVTRATRPGRIRRFIRISVLLTVMGLVDLARGEHPRWRLVLAGGALTAAGLVLRHDPAGVILLPGLLLLFAAPLAPDSPAADRKRRSLLERELAAYSTAAQRCDLEATLDQYPDGATREMRAILSQQAMAAVNSGVPGMRAGPG